MGHTSRVIIYKDKLICENPNSFRTNGLLTIKNYTPFAKNPTLAKFFREIGYADELGSGFIKITKNSYLYSGKPPIFEDKEMFRVTIPLLRDEKLDEKDLINLANGTISGTINGTLNLVLKEIENKNNITQSELAKRTGIALRTVKRAIDELKENGYIKREGSNKTGYWKLLKSTSGTINGTINGTLNLVLDELKNKNNITQKELVERTGMSLRTIIRVINELKENGYIKREGSKKTGYWVILKK